MKLGNLNSKKDIFAHYYAKENVFQNHLARQLIKIFVYLTKSEINKLNSFKQNCSSTNYDKIQKCIVIRFV